MLVTVLEALDQLREVRRGGRLGEPAASTAAGARTGADRRPVHGHTPITWCLCDVIVKITALSQVKHHEYLQWPVSVRQAAGHSRPTPDRHTFDRDTSTSMQWMTFLWWIVRATLTCRGHAHTRLQRQLALIPLVQRTSRCTHSTRPFLDIFSFSMILTATLCPVWSRPCRILYGDRGMG